MIDLRPDHLDIVRAILAEYLPDMEVRAFGSRVTRTAKAHSDLDLAIMGNVRIAGRTMTRLKLAFEESDLPFRVDMVDWQTIGAEFRRIIDANYEVLQPASESDKFT